MRRLMPLAVIAAILTLLPLSARGDHRDGHDGGRPAESDSQTTTEATDSDSVDNNISDSGDNAHPSGNDRSVESGASTDQGSASSDPDNDDRGPDRSGDRLSASATGTGNGGLDKPDGAGGLDQIDQDRNNGCGNDDDFEDDNEGWCGGRPASLAAAELAAIEGGNGVAPEDEPFVGLPVTGDVGPTPRASDPSDSAASGGSVGKDESLSGGELSGGGGGRGLSLFGLPSFLPSTGSPIGVLLRAGIGLLLAGLFLTSGSGWARRRRQKALA